MRNVYIRLCGGFSVMVRPDTDLDLDLSVIRCFETTVRSDALMKFPYRGIEVTMYSSGGLIFHHFEDQDAAGEYAREIWKRAGADPDLL